MYDPALTQAPVTGRPAIPAGAPCPVVGGLQPYSCAATNAPPLPPAWDYLIVSAGDARQAEFFERQLALRRDLRVLGDVGRTLVVADPPGTRAGSGGSTLCCWMRVLESELPPDARADHDAWREILLRRRILILHAGGDSRRLAAYRAWGKCFLPLPGGAGLFDTLFDRQIPVYLALPAPRSGTGHTVIASGDVLLEFDPREVDLAEQGVTGLGCLSPAQQAAAHGVYRAAADGTVEQFFQKPTVAEQAASGCLDRQGRAILDIGVMSLDATTAVRLLRAAGVRPGDDGSLVWSGPLGEAIGRLGLDFYREIACALGSRATAATHAAAARDGGSAWSQKLLADLFSALEGTLFRVHTLAQCRFLHFGTSRDLIRSGNDLCRTPSGLARPGQWLDVANEVCAGGKVLGDEAWVEACRLRAPLTLGGENVVVGLDVDCPTTLPRGACVDVLPGRTPEGRPVWFIRSWGIDDDFKACGGSATFCGRPLDQWLASVGALPEEVWDPALPPGLRSAWNARLVPAEIDPRAHARWLWMFEPESATEAQKTAWRSARRYSHAEIAALADHAACWARRVALRAARICHDAARAFSRESPLAARELAHLVRCAESPAEAMAALLAAAHEASEDPAAPATLDSLIVPRMMHTLATVVETLGRETLGGEPALRAGCAKDRAMASVLSDLSQRLPEATLRWLSGLGLGVDSTPADWARRAREVAFARLARSIVLTGAGDSPLPTSALRSDEIVWGRAPARLDLCGGWTDTPPYALEHGGCVLNAAVDLNGQPPIQAFARVTDEPVLRIASIDRGTQVKIASIDELFHYRDIVSEFSLAKGAVVLSGLVPHSRHLVRGRTLREILEAFGGGLELTTLAAIPRGSGLGTSSILGAVLLAVLDRVMGRPLDAQGLFHRVLRLEQVLGTGGGWQDQIGGIADGVKVTTTAPGMTPRAVVEFVPGEILDPGQNGGQTLLYYTGITRVARNILEQVVGRYLDREPDTLATLARLRALPAAGAAALARRDLAALGRVVDAAWQLNKRLDPDSTTPAIEAICERIRPHVHGAKLLGAGGGGFLLAVCKSPASARRVRALLESNPPNPRARFFPFAINHEGLRVTGC
ncbi:MAG: hypothetical protein NUV77_02040 [Thermoguttaceae bacterium]|nr:hypothetical protein [Thermoguttaceae bacterium]